MFNLSNSNDDCMHLTLVEWPWVLSIAQAFGWEPAGVISAWSGEVYMEGYTANDCASVTDSDAANIASALTLALAEPQHPAWSTQKILGNEAPLEQKVYLVNRVIEFCRHGGFGIG